MSKVAHMDRQIRRNFALRLKSLRQLRYRTATEFAQILGVEAQRYMKWEKGAAEPSYAWLLRVCQMLGCTPDFLLLGFTSNSQETVPLKPAKPTQLKPRRKKQNNNG
jgi:transcriptional regulator with XRE-family HTH domain